MSVAFTRRLQAVLWIRRVGWAIRMTAIQGPWQPLVLACCRRYAHNPRIAATPHTLLPELDPRSIAARLAHDGWAEGFLLPAEHVDRILAFTEQSPQQRYEEPHRHCEAVWEVACDPKVLEVVRLYLGGEPILYHSVIWRNKGVNNPEHVRDSHLYRFHFDVADVKSLVLYTYLSDVDEQSGPHMIISGTQHSKPLWDTIRLYLGDQTAQARYADRIRLITGKCGTTFFEEQTAYHKQLVPQKPRMMLRITYTLWRRPGPHRFLPRLRRAHGAPQR